MEKELQALAESAIYADRRLSCCMTCSCVEGETGELNVRYGLRFKRFSKVLRDLPDLSGNALKVRELMLRLNRNRVSIFHIDDVIADFLAVNAD